MDEKKTMCQTILIVEDDEGIREALQFTLEIEGYQVFTASNGKEGIEALLKINSPCLILLDLMMPIMNGWEFISEIKLDPKLAQIPVVVVTAFSDRAKNMKVPILKKPVDMEALLKLVKDHCDQEASLE